VTLAVSSSILGSPEYPVSPSASCTRKDLQGGERMAALVVVAEGTLQFPHGEDWSSIDPGLYVFSKSSLR